MNVFFGVIKCNGFFGLYKGLFPTIIGITPFLAIKLGTFDWLSSNFIKPN